MTASDPRVGEIQAYYQDDTITLHHGDSLKVALTLEPESVDCIVTSPPYYGLRDYVLVASWLRARAVAVRGEDAHD